MNPLPDKNIENKSNPHKTNHQKKHRRSLWFRIKKFFYQVFLQHKKAHAWVDNEVKRAIEWERQGAKEAGDDIFLDYSILCIKAAGKVAKKFFKQDHSGTSASLTLGLIRRLCSWKPLSPLTGNDDEWSPAYTYHGENVEHYQNNRDYRVFKVVYPDGRIEYSQNEIIDIINDDEVWATYPPIDEPGSLDDNNEDVQAYFQARNMVRDKHNAEITFPYSPRTYRYKWNFETKKLEQVDD